MHNLTEMDFVSLYFVGVFVAVSLLVFAANHSPRISKMLTGR